MSELKRVRHLMGWTQVEMAEALGISQSEVAQIESGNRTMSKPVYRLFLTMFSTQILQVRSDND